MNRTLRILAGQFLLFSLLIPGCVHKKDTLTVRLTNDLSTERSGETVTLSVDDLKSLKEGFDAIKMVIRDKKTGEYLPHQILDQNGNGDADAVIFQPVIGPNTTTELVIESLVENREIPVPPVSTYSRFVPERIDDYAWENDRVAFRMYGPEAQRLTEAGDPGGTLSSGIDCWLKRVDYPIINKWYKKASDGTGSYHEDTGEGLDNYHVGPSRGCGGTGIWLDETLYTSRNFTEWRRFAEGPIRTSFVLSYAPWEAKERIVSEQKSISLDLGSNLSRVEMSIESNPSVEEVTIGVAIHDKDGMATINEELGWYSYWQPHGDSELGTAIVVDPANVKGYTEYVVDEKDRSHLYVHVKPVDGKVVYYTGFAWQKSGQFVDSKGWEEYLSLFAQKLASPIEVKILLD